MLARLGQRLLQRLDLLERGHVGHLPGSVPAQGRLRHSDVPQWRGTIELISAHALVQPLRVPLHHADIDAFEQPVQLLHRQRGHVLLARPDEPVLLQPLVTQSGMQTFPLLRRGLCA